MAGSFWRWSTLCRGGVQVVFDGGELVGDGGEPLTGSGRWAMRP